VVSMDSETRRVLNDAGLLQSRKRHIERLQQLYNGSDGEPRPFRLNGLAKGGQILVGEAAEARVDEALRELAAESKALAEEEVFRPLVVEFGLYGVHYLDKVLGADVFDLDGSWQVRLVRWRVGELPVPDLETEPVWRLARDLARAFVAADVTVPFFGLPTIASPLNVAVNLYGQEFLLAMLGSPAAARRDLRIITDVQWEMHKWYLAHLPAEQLQPVVGAWRTQPPGFGQICGCTTQLVSAGLYRDMVAPFDSELLKAYAHGGMIHLCGTHTQHLPVWRDMPELRAVQLNDRASHDLARCAAALRRDQVLYVNPCEGMDARRIVEVAKGMRVVVVGG
jgi:hypothetical protein